MMKRASQAASGRVVDPLLIEAMYDDPQDARDRMDDEAAALLHADVMAEQARKMGLG